MILPAYNTSTRGLLVASVHRHINKLSTAGLSLLLRTLPADPLGSAHIFCSITGLRRDVVRACIKHNVSIAFEVKSLLDKRLQSTKGAVAPGEEGNETTRN